MSIHSRYSTFTQSPPPTYAFEDDNSSFAPPPANVRRRRLGRVVAVPQSEGSAAAALVRCWPPALSGSGVTQEEWLRFVDQLNKILADTEHLSAIGRLIALGRAQSVSATAQFVERSNRTFFNPRGLSAQLITGRDLQQIIQSQSPVSLSPRMSASASFSAPASPDPEAPPPSASPKGVSRRFSQIRAAATSPTARTVAKHAATVSMFIPVVRRVVQRTLPPDGPYDEDGGSAPRSPHMRGDAIDTRLDSMAPYIAEVDRDVPHPTGPAMGSGSGSWWDERVEVDALKEFAKEHRASTAETIASRWDSLAMKASREQQLFLERRIRITDPLADLRTPEEILWLVVINLEEKPRQQPATDESKERPSARVREQDSGYASASSNNAQRVDGAEWIIAEGRSASPVAEDAD